MTNNWGQFEEGINELELIKTPGESDVVLRKKALDSLARNRAAKEFAKQTKQAKQRASKARREQAAKQVFGENPQQNGSFKGGHSWRIRMMEQMGTYDVRLCKHRSDYNCITRLNS